MKKFLIITFLISLNNLMFSQTNLKTYDCYLEGTDINSFTKVEAPTIFQDANILFKTQTINIDVNYVGNWPGPAQSAFNHAVKIWKYLINSPVPITIEAEWKALGEESGPLAQTQTTSYKKNFPNVPAQDVNYPVSLAEALSETELNGSEEEIKIEVNSDMANNNKWYYGLDGNAPAEMYDLVSVILHEVAHGLGITHSFKVSNNLGSWGQGYANENEKGYMQSFDGFGVVGPFSTTIYKLTNTNTYPNPSDGLAGAIQSNNVYFDGPISKQMNLNNLPRLYAPLVFKSGSSIAHLDEDTFPAGNSNSCLSPQLGMAESIHSPGELGLALLQDLGWNINRLITVLSPGPGLAYMPGQSKTISWTDNMGGAIALELLKLDAFGEYVLYSVITSHPSPRGEINIYNWTIPNVEGTFKIRMIDNTFSNEGFGLSYSFIISNQAQVLTPVIFPPGDNYFSPRTISITSATPGATIYYTDDGSEPSTTNGTEYTEQFTISTDKVLKAKAFKSGFPESETTTEIYVFGEQLLPPSISPESGTYLEGTNVIISWPADLEAYYNWSVDGSVPGDPKLPGNSYQLIWNPSTLTFPAGPVNILVRTYKNGAWGPLISVQYTFIPYVRIAQVDDEITGDNSFGRWNRWENNQWKDYPDIRFQRPAASTDWFMQAQQDYKFNTYRKYNVWSKNSGENYFINHSQIPVSPSTSSVLAHFKNTYNATIKNNLEGTLSVNSGNFYFKDPWYVGDDSDPKGNRNRGINPLPVLMDFKTTPNITTDSDHKGVFLDQDPTFDPLIPNYSVKADQTQPIDLGGSIGTRDFFFLNWSAEPSSGADFQNENALETGVVFKEDSVTVKANLKGNLISNSTSGFSSNTQRKLVRTDDGIFHLVYVSLGQVWYTHSLTGDSVNL